MQNLDTNAPLTVLIIEDELAAADRLSRLVLEIVPNAHMLGVLHSVESALEWFAHHPQPDVVLMDIHLADGSSFEIFEHVTITAAVIFVTAYDQYALQAFRFNALHYVLKPVKKTVLADSLERVQKKRQTSAPVPDYQNILAPLAKQETEGGGLKKRFLIKYGQTIKVVDTQDVAYFHTADKIVFLTTFQGKHYPLDFTLEQIEAMISPADFFRINRQFIVNQKAVKELYAYSKSRVKLELQPPYDQEAIVSVERSSEFKKWLTE